MDLKEIIVRAIHEAAESRETELEGELTDNSVLLESGLDSLGYAIVVTLLDEELGYDPFVIMEEPVYPATLKEFVDIYTEYGKVEGK